MTDLNPAGWRRDNLLIIQGCIRNTIIHRVYVDTGSSIDIIYKHYLCLLSDRWKEELKPTNRTTDRIYRAQPVTPMYDLFTIHTNQHSTTLY